MKVSDSNQSSKILHYIQQTKSMKPLEKKEVQQGSDQSHASVDKVNLSIQSKEINKIREVIEMTPEVRAERIAELRKLIDEGRYQVDAETLAEKMIKDALFELNR